MGDQRQRSTQFEGNVFVEEALLQTVEEGPQKGKLYTIVFMDSSISYYECGGHVICQNGPIFVQ